MINKYKKKHILVFIFSSGMLLICFLFQNCSPSLFALQIGAPARAKEKTEVSDLIVEGINEAENIKYQIQENTVASSDRSLASEIAPNERTEIRSRNETKKRSNEVNGQNN